MNIIQKICYSVLKKLADCLAKQDKSKLIAGAKVLGAIMWNCLPTRRKLATRAISKHLGLDKAEATVIARKNFNNIAQSFLEICLAPKFNFDSVIIEYPENTEYLRVVNRPVVAAVAHLGSWELLAGLLGNLKRESERMVVVRSNKNEVLRKFMFEMRGGSGGRVIGHRDSSFTILKTLKKNGLVAFLVDHNCRKDEAIFLPFLGKVAAVNKGPALLAARTDALVFPVFLVREAGVYRYIVDEALDCAKLEGSLDDKVRHISKFYTQAVEKYIKKYPEQWFWIHKRWKTQMNGDE